MGGGGTPTYCWGIDLDFHPMGYQPISDEAFGAWMATMPAEEADPGSAGTLRPTLPKPSEPDPRHGELYEIVRALEPDFL